MDINPKIFREYDIRGIVGQDLDDGVANLLGRAIGTYFADRGKKEVAVGRDCRLSSPSFSAALTAGLISTGRDVTDLGVIPTPLLYFSVYEKKMESGVMITGSHNPPEYNGFKMMSGEETLYGQHIQDIFAVIQKGRFADGKGSSRALDIIPEYQSYVAAQVRFAKRLKVIVDAGNGTGGSVAVPLLEKLGCEVVPLYCEMDGRFPNHHPDPTLPEAMEDLIRTVRETKADLGIGYDGDADRLGVVDDEGRLIWGDQLMIVFARDILPSHPGGGGHLGGQGVQGPLR